MTLRHSIPIAWRPLGVTDAIDGSMARQGSMAKLSNLIPDPSTLGVFICRPAATLLVDFNAVGTSGPFSAGFSSGFQTTFFAGGTAGNITCLRVFGGRAFGMVSGPNGFDYPFVYDLVQNHLLVVTGGQDQTKLPNTVATTGAWVPPTLAHVGTKVLVTHPGFTGGGPTNLFFGYFDITAPTAITWTAGNMLGGSAISFLVPPTAVANFNGRAYWLINGTSPVAVFSDVLVPINCTNANQVLSFDDQQPLTALAPLPLQNQVTGGIVQALMVFKSAAQVWQITGDVALNNLAKNALNIATGTNSPLGTAVTPKGIGFISPDGFRIIDFNAQISDPIGWDGQGKTTPFIFSGVPSRVVAACTGTMYRVTVQDTTLFNSPFVEYWLDIVRGQWTGPHTFQPQAIDAWNNTFIISAMGVPGKLWRSDPFVSANSTFVENGAQLSWQYLTTFFPDSDQMAEMSMIETTITMGLDQNVSYPAAVLDQNGQQLGAGTVFMPAAAGAPIWGSFIWGQANWGVPPVALFPRQIPWTAPVVFRRGQFQIAGNSSSNIRLGALHCRVELLGYLQQGIAA